jgi:hypothetical protein
MTLVKVFTYLGDGFPQRNIDDPPAAKSTQWKAEAFYA